MIYTKRIRFGFIFIGLAALASLVTGCDGTYNYSVVGYVQDQNRAPVANMQTEVCYQIIFKQGTPISGCQPVLTDDQGIFDTLIAGRFQQKSDFVRIQLSLKSGEQKVPGKVLRRSISVSGDASQPTISGGATVVFNVTVQQN